MLLFFYLETTPLLLPLAFYFLSLEFIVFYGKPITKVIFTCLLLGTLRRDDDDGSEKVGKTNDRICALSSLIASIWTRSICQKQATFPGFEFLRTLFRFEKRKENSSSYVHVLRKTADWEVSRRSRAVHVKEMY